MRPVCSNVPFGNNQGDKTMSNFFDYMYSVNEKKPVEAEKVAADELPEKSVRDSLIEELDGSPEAAKPE